MKFNVVLKSLLIILIGLIGLAHAQSDYPKKPITIVVPYAVGGGAGGVALLARCPVGQRDATCGYGRMSRLRSCAEKAPT